ncbi:77 kDa echinoderm microtubule-associated protein-like [Tubulanus polymorphus]|uniref:77 kDa echinoderm microtubule-associated protein-like n=1 Tax=Tubulanus polymorphus TaxID=672921 RepID=UPI003DA207FF
MDYRPASVISSNAITLQEVLDCETESEAMQTTVNHRVPSSKFTNAVRGLNSSLTSSAMQQQQQQQQQQPNTASSALNASIKEVQKRAQRLRAYRYPQNKETTGNQPSGPGRGLTQDSLLLKSDTTIAPDQELMHLLIKPMKDCSRQRLRSIHMGLRKYGNMDCRISSKDISLVMQENGLKLSSRVFQMLVEKFEDQLGVDYEKLWKTLVYAQSKTGRDSVEALNTDNANDTSNTSVLPPEARDQDLIFRVECELARSRLQPDLNELRRILQIMDKQKTGQLEQQKIIELFNTDDMPIYGALLTSLLRRCDDEANGKVSWPEMLSFLEKAQETFLESLPPDEKPEFFKLQEPWCKRDNSFGSLDTEKERTLSNLRKVVMAYFKTAESIEVRWAKLTQGQIKISVNKTKELLAEYSEPGAQMTEATPVSANAPINTQNSLTVPPVSKEQKSVAPTKTGFFSSVRGLLRNAGKKKGEQKQSSIPLIQVDKHNDVIHEDTGEMIPAQGRGGGVSVKDKPLGEHPVKHSDANNTISVDIGGKKQLLFLPDNLKLAGLNSDPPRERLQLDWVYGYRGNDCRSNIFVLGSGEIAYYIANIVVIYKIEERQQRHYKAHSSEIKSMAVHSDGVTIATGQSCLENDKKIEYLRYVYAYLLTQAEVRVWRCDTMQTLHVLGCKYFQKSVIALAFAKNKDYLVAVDSSEEHTMSVWDTLRGKMITSVQVGTPVVCDIKFNPRNADLIVTIGLEHLVWWKFIPDSASLHLQAKADYQSHLRAKYINTMIHNDRGDLITGDSNGTIYIWGYSTNKVVNLVKHAHEGPVFSLLLIKNVLLTGGRDNKVRSWIWDRYMDSVGILKIPAHEGGVRMLKLYKDMLLMGTTTNSILTANINTQYFPLQDVQLNPGSLTQSHYDDLRGLTSIQLDSNTSLFLTAGYDSSLCLFDASRHVALWKHVMTGAPALCVDATSTGSLIAVGTKDGNSYSMELNVYRTDTCELVKLEGSKNTKWASNNCRLAYNVSGIWSSKPAKEGDVTTLSVSHNNKLIAMGNSNGYVSLYKHPCVGKGVFCHTYKGPCFLQNSCFTRDSRYIITVGGVDTCIMQWMLV